MFEIALLMLTSYVVICGTMAIGVLIGLFFKWLNRILV